MEEIQRKIKSNLTGRRFGRLVVLAGLRNEKGALVWQCKCDCGNETYAKTGALNTGTKKNCGCMSRERDRDRQGSVLGD